MLVTISTTKQQNTHTKIGNKRAKKVSKHPKKKKLINKRPKKKKKKKNNNNNNNNNGRFFFSIFLQGVEPTGWALLLAWLARWPWLLRAGAELFLLQRQQRKRTQWRWTWRKEKHKTRVPRYSLSLSHTHTHTHTFVSSSPRHSQGTPTSLPFNLVGTKTSLTCLWPSTLVNDFYFYFCDEFRHFAKKNFLAKEFSVANSLFFSKIN